jgi:biotin carboxyl carrier protein
MPDYKVTVNGKPYEVSIGRITDERVDATVNGKTFSVQIEAPQRAASKTPRIETKPHVVNAADSPDRTSPPDKVARMGKGDILAPLPGLMLKILVKEGDSVAEGQTVAIMEAMKMENEIEAPFSGVVARIAVSPGENVLENALIMKIGG